MLYKGIDLTEYFKILDIRRDILPPIKLTMLDIPGKDGNLYVKSKFNPRTIEVDIEVKGKDKEDLRQKISKLATKLYDGKLGILRFKDEIDKHYEAILTDTTYLNEIYVYGQATLTFICPDPYKKGEKIEVEIDNNIKFYNRGIANAIAVLELEVLTDTDEIVISNVTTGKYIKLSGNYVQGDKIIIDLEKQYVERNGYNDMKNVAIDSDFIRIMPGENQITISSNVNGVLSYIERWL